MPFRARIEELSKKLEQCKDEAEAQRLAQELHSAIHDQIGKIRERVAGYMPLLSDNPMERGAGKDGSPQEQIQEPGGHRDEQKGQPRQKN